MKRVVVLYHENVTKNLPGCDDNGNSGELTWCSCINF
jgi:hypothetical protein